MSKSCRYGCNTKIEWDTTVGKFVEVDTKLFHSMARCRKLLKDQGIEIPSEFDRYGGNTQRKT